MVELLQVVGGLFCFAFEFLWKHRVFIGVGIFIYAILRHFEKMEERIATLEHEALKRKWDI